AATKSDKRKFRVSLPRNLFSEIEEITFQAELYNDNYELTNIPEVQLRIQNEEKKSFDFLFSPTGDKYSLKIGRFPEGTYTFEAQTELNGIKHQCSGKFVIQAVNLEQLTGSADHGLLRELAARYQGDVFLPDQIPALTQKVLDSPMLKP